MLLCVVKTLISQIWSIFNTNLSARTSNVSDKFKADSFILRLVEYLQQTLQRRMNSGQKGLLKFIQNSNTDQKYMYPDTSFWALQTFRQNRCNPHPLVMDIKKKKKNNLYYFLYTEVDREIGARCNFQFYAIEIEIKGSFHKLTQRYHIWKNYSKLIPRISSELTLAIKNWRLSYIKPLKKLVERRWAIEKTSSVLISAWLKRDEFKSSRERSNRLGNVASSQTFNQRFWGASLRGRTAWKVPRKHCALTHNNRRRPQGEKAMEEYLSERRAHSTLNLLKKQWSTTEEILWYGVAFLGRMSVRHIYG